LGIGDWGLGIGDWGLGPIPNPQSPIPIVKINFILKRNINIYIKNLLFKKIINFINNKITFKKNFFFFIYNQNNYILKYNNLKSLLFYIQIN